MNMNFDRLECQRFIESQLGCTEPSNFYQYREALQNYIVPASARTSLREATINDAISFFYKSAISFVEATANIMDRQYSWAVVKLYYSVFYSLRAIMLSDGLAIVKDGKGNFFYIDTISSGNVIKVSGKQKGDHKNTIKLFKDVAHSRGWPFLGEIGGVELFDWIMDKREFINYRVSTFSEPAGDYGLFTKFVEDKNTVNHLIKQYLKEDYNIYCFDEYHSMYATPAVLINFLNSKLRGSGVKSFDEDKKNNLDEFIKRKKINELEVIRSLIVEWKDVV